MAALGVVGAGLAVVRLLADVARRAGVGLAGDHAAVGELAHAAGVGHLHPLEGVGVDAQVPGVHLVRVAARQQREVAGDHQALDVVGVGGVERLANGVAQAGHLRPAGPVPGRQRAPGVERVALRVARHARPIHPAHELPPAQDLAHETLAAGELDRARLPGRDRGVDDLAWVQQLDVERERQPGVEQRGRARAHRVLVGTEPGQGVGDEVRQAGARLAPAQRPEQVFRMS